MPSKFWRQIKGCKGARVHCTHWAKKKRLDQATYCLHAPKFEARLFDRLHLGETTLRASALDLQSEDYEAKTQTVAAGWATDVLSILLQTEVSQKNGLTEMAAVNFLPSKMKNNKSSIQSFFCRPVVVPKRVWKLAETLFFVSLPFSFFSVQFSTRFFSFEVFHGNLKFSMFVSFCLML